MKNISIKPSSGFYSPLQTRRPPSYELKSTTNPTIHPKLWRFQPHELRSVVNLAPSSELHHCEPPPWSPQLPFARGFCEPLRAGTIPPTPNASHAPQTRDRDRARREPFRVVTISNLHRRE